MTTSPLLVIAHRGASSYAPENTFAAYDLALQMGVFHIELDVEFTNDGHIVVIHDDTVDRTTNGSGLVTNHTLAELQELDAGSWLGVQFRGEQIRTFDEVLARYKGRVHFHAEIKGRSLSLSKGTADIVRKHSMEKEVTVTSFQDVRLEEMRAYAPELPTAWLVREISDPIITQAREMGVTQLCPQAQAVTPDLVNRLHTEGFVARAWGVTTEELMRQVVQAEADGMTINFPDKLIEYLKSENHLWE
jgi:glycerophosphoryl diester phosphodiesterase